MRFIAHTGKSLKNFSKRDSPLGDESLNSLGLRHLIAFRTAYREGDISAAAAEMYTDRRTLLKMIQAIETSAHDQLFINETNGKISPTAFGERLFNDTRSLEQHLKSLNSTAQSIRDRGRVLRLATSPALLRTRAFQQIFATLGIRKDFRLSVVPVEPGSEGSALSQGDCDIYLTIGSLLGDRFVADPVCTVKCREYIRGGKTIVAGAKQYSVSGVQSEQSPDSGDHALLKLDENEWVLWLDYPVLCPEGTIILAPEINVDPNYWNILERAEPTNLELQAYHIKQHSYEFLSPLARSLAELTKAQ